MEVKIFPDYMPCLNNGNLQLENKLLNLNLFLSSLGQPSRKQARRLDVVTLLMNLANRYA